MKQYIPFKIRYDIEQRKQKFEAYRLNKPNFYPLIVEPNPKSKLPSLKNSRFCCEANKTLLYLKATLSQKVYTGQSQNAFYLYIGKKLLIDGNITVQKLYQENKDQDGFLYVQYSEMEVF